jgi:hypothetical protein
VSRSPLAHRSIRSLSAKNLTMLTVRDSHVFSFMGSAFTVIAIQMVPHSWVALNRAIEGPRNWHRLFGLLHRHQSICYLIRLHSFHPFECVTVWQEYSSTINSGQLTIHLPQTIGPSNVPPGTTIELLRRQWVSNSGDILHKSKWHPELQQCGSCCIVKAQESNGLESG